MKRLTILYILCLAAFQTAAQSALLSDVQLAYQLSESQWICRELDQMKAWSNYKTNTTAGYIYTASDFESVIPELRYLPDSAEQEAFRRLYFPNGPQDPSRYLKLRALSDLYFPLFDKKLMSSSLSRNYKYLPLIISGLNQQYSSAQDRTGLWGMPFLIARKYQLRVDSLVDERRGGDFTTVAAANWISDMSAQMQHDFAQTVLACWKSAAYAKNNLNKSESETLLKFYAYTAVLFSKGEAPFMLNTCFDVLGQYESIWFEKNVSLDAVAALLGESKIHLHETNPVYVGNDVQANYRKVPFSLEKSKAAKFEMLQDSIYRWQPSRRPVHAEPAADAYVYHIVKRGETLGTIARKHHTSTKKIKELNHLKKDNIREGQRLKVLVHKASGNQGENTVVHQDESKPKDEKPKSTTDSKPKNTTATKEEKATVYTVRRGDSLWKIANKFHVSEKQIKKWNNCGDKLQPGQKLKIYKK